MLKATGCYPGGLNSHHRLIIRYSSKSTRSTCKLRMSLSIIDGPIITSHYESAEPAITFPLPVWPALPWSNVKHRALVKAPRDQHHLYP